MKNMSNFTAIIITKDRFQKLEQAIISLDILPQIQEIVVIDNNSSIEKSPILKSDKVVWIKNDTLKGVAENRNCGLQKSDSEMIMFLDDDAFIKEIDLSAIIEYMDKNPDVGIIAPRLLYPDGRVQESIRSFPTPLALLWRGLRLYKIYSPQWYKRYVEPLPKETAMPTEVDWCIGACQIVKSDLFKKIGHFDDKYFFGYEDADLCLRAKKAGFKTIYWPHATVVHEYTRSSSNLFSKAAMRHIASILRFFCKHYRFK